MNEISLDSTLNKVQIKEHNVGLFQMPKYGLEAMVAHFIIMTFSHLMYLLLVELPCK
jgi:hypothetical protein